MASMPFTFGIRTSIKVISGWYLRKSANAWSPFKGFRDYAHVGLCIDLAGNAGHHQRVIVHGHYTDDMRFSHASGPPHIC